MSFYLLLNTIAPLSFLNMLLDISDWCQVLITFEMEIVVVNWTSNMKHHYIFERLRSFHEHNCYLP